MNFGEISTRHKIITGAVQGLMAWLAYGVVECAFWSILPALAGRPPLPGPASTQALEAFGVFAAAGLLTGIVAALILASLRSPALRDAEPAALLRAAATMPLVWALAASLAAFGSLSRPAMILRLAVAIGFTAMLAWSALPRRDGWRGRFRFLTSPWSVSLLLTGLPWLDQNLLACRSAILKLLAGGACLLALACFSWLARKLSRGSGAARSRPLVPAGRLAALATAVAASVILSRSLAPENFSGSALTALRAGSDSDKPNVLLITLDTVRADHLSVYGYHLPTSPRLQSLAQQSTLYSRAIAPSDITLSSHASIFTGLYVRRHGAHMSEPGGHALFLGGFPLASKFQTLAGTLSRHGYATAAVIANTIFLAPEFRLNQGFETYRLLSPGREPARYPPYFLRTALLKLRPPPPPPQAGGPYRGAGDVSRAALAEIDRLQGRPFFLFVNYMDAHEPYRPPHPYDTLFPGKDRNISPEDFEHLTWKVNSLSRPFTAAERSAGMSQYDGGIAYMDAEVGWLLGQLRQRRLYDNTLVIVTSDHGEAFGEHDLAAHGGVGAYEELVHVPLIIHYPQQKQRQQVPQTVSLIDIFPTVLDVLGVPLPQGIDGRSLRADHAGKPGPVITEVYPAPWLEKLHPRFRRIDRALYSGPWKLISSTSGRRELYNLSADGAETSNLFRPGDTASRQMEEQLEGWLRVTPAEKSPSFQLTKEEFDRLKSLGYVQ